jgi:hypothetical protein
MIYADHEGLKGYQTYFPKADESQNRETRGLRRSRHVDQQKAEKIA